MKRTTLVLLTGLLVAGCAGTDQNTTRRTVSGAGIGALSGLAIGATGGLLYDQISKDQGGS